MRRSRSKRRRAGAVALVAAVVLNVVSTANAQTPTTVQLDTAASFAVLAGTGISNVPTSAITGDVGLSPGPGSAITGLTCAEVAGTIYATDATGDPCFVVDPGLLTTAKTDLTDAYLDAAGRTPDTTYSTADNQLGGQTLTPGVYRFGAATTANLIGNLTLSGDANAVWIFQATSSLVTASSSTVTLTGGARACNVFWQVGSSATLGSSSTLVGTVMALTSIAVNSSATVEGRVLAQNGAVTLDMNTITRPAACAVVDDGNGDNGNGDGDNGNGDGDGDDQVTTIPSGGIQTGGGSTASVEEFGLFAVGLGLLAAAGAAFAVRRRVTKQD